MKIIKISFLISLIILTIILMTLGLEQVADLMNHYFLLYGILIPIIGGITTIILVKLIKQIIKQFNNKTNEKNI